jgi:hypothetical protein
MQGIEVIEIKEIGANGLTERMTPMGEALTCAGCKG